VLPFLAVEIVVLLLIAFVPEITLFLPRLLGFA
jgi:TRAP-type C4-dicarboxylate transport system permease large subunit